MKTVYLHIGMHKTGSTSIQRFLARADDALAKQGVIYPEAGRPDTEWSNQYGQHELAWSIRGKRGITDEQVWDELREEIEKRPGQRVLVSSEDFDACTSDQVQRIVAHLDPYPIQVVVYLRPPVQLLRSAYKQRVKMGTYSDSFVQFVEEMIPRCNYLNLASRWEQCDRVDSLTISLFDKVKKEPGLEASFADAVGIDFEEVQPFTGPPTNSSPPDDVVQIARWINKIATVGEEIETWQTLTNRARSNLLGQRWPGRWLTTIARPFWNPSLGREQAAELVRKELGRAHEQFLQKYVDPDNWEYLPLRTGAHVSID